MALEAGITGTPVLLTDVCGFPQIEKIRGGMIVKPDSEAIRKGLQALLQDPEDLKQRGKQLKYYVSENYTWDSLIDKYISIFESILT